MLLDLACGRAGYGLELVARSGARLVGLDFAPAAIEQARANAQRLGLADRADLRVGDMTATGLDPASVTAVLCVDAAQFPPDFGATFVEAHRGSPRRAPCSPGGGACPRPGVPERIAGSTCGGHGGRFVDVARSREDWLRRRDAWRAVCAARPTTRLQSLQAEGASSSAGRSAGAATGRRAA